MASRDSIVVVQLSDLHFGDSAVERRWDVIRGYRPHDFQLTQALPNALESIYVDLDLPDEHKLDFVVSGDVTVSGTSGQFDLAQEYLARSRQLDANDLSSWGIGPWTARLRKVPGNHDHWNGRMPRPLGPWKFQQAYNPDLFPARFEPHAWGPVDIDGGALRLEISGADSQSGFSSSTTNLLARGSLDPTHLGSLRSATPAAAGTSIVRALVLHHPVCARPRVRTGIEDLDQPSRKLVVDHATSERVGVVLVGHRHGFMARPPAKGRDGLVRHFWELQAPTTFQGVAKDAHHGFLVHHLEPASVANKVRWTCHPYFWRADRKRFTYEPDDRVVFSLDAI